MALIALLPELLLVHIFMAVSTFEFLKLKFKIEVTLYARRNLMFSI